MGQRQSIRCSRNRLRWETIWTCLWAVSLATFVSVVAADELERPSSTEEATSQEADAAGVVEAPGEFPLEEPKTLLTPARLIPVEDVTAAPEISTDVAPASAPAVRLAPEPLKVSGKEAKEITRSVAGIRPANFKGITPGASSRDDILEKLGEPQETTSSDEKEELVFKLGPFPSVQITLVDKVVSSIVIRLAEPTPRGDVVTELNLEEFEPVSIRDDAHRLLGEVYPERGLMFAFQGDVEAESEPLVGQVVLERVSVEPFLLRVEQTAEDQITKRLENLRIVQQLLPDDAEAYGLAAQLDEQSGRLASARTAVMKALEIEPDRVGYQIESANIQHQLGNHKEALETIRAVLAEEDLSSIDEATGRFVLGRILATTPHYDHQQAMQETVSAIRLAAARLKTEKLPARKKARRLLFDAELSLSEILAHGPWKQRHSVVPQWLASAEKVANEHVEADGASRDVLLDLYRTSLHCLLVLDGQGSPTNIADAAIQLGRQLISESEDLDYQSLVEWKLGTGLWYAAQIEHQQGKAGEAMRFANNAEALMSAANDVRGESAETAHHLAQLRFLMGSIHSIYKRDDDTACVWYDKALPQLKKSHPLSMLDDRGLIGEQLVSVGISYWETDRRRNAIAITKEGAELIHTAVKAGSFKRAALVIPYQNLAEMYRQLGDEEEAEKMAERAAEYAPPQDIRR